MEKFSEDEIALLGRTVCRGATPDELALFVATCRRTGLDPNARQIYWIQRAGRGTIQVSIDGQRSIAERTGEMGGLEQHWCGDDGVWHDVWLPSTPPAAARTRVYRKGCSHPFTGIAKWSEYSNPSGALWRRMGALMLGKCSSSLALRCAFPIRLSGLYTDSEMEQASSPEATLGPMTDDTYIAWIESLSDVATGEGYSALVAAIQTSPEPMRVALRSDTRSWSSLKDLAATWEDSAGNDTGSPVTTPDGEAPLL
jgi:phage recombination protein Bet